jgi:HEAT repeat protein
VNALKNIAEKSDDPATRKKAVFWLGQKARSEEAFTFLGTRLRDDPDPEVRGEVLMALAQAPDNKGIPALIDVAKSHPDKAMRKKAIFWLGQSKDPRARQAILDIVSDVK